MAFPFGFLPGHLQDDLVAANVRDEARGFGFGGDGFIEAAHTHQARAADGHEAGEFFARCHGFEVAVEPDFLVADFEGPCLEIRIVVASEADGGGIDVEIVAAVLPADEQVGFGAN